MRRFFREVAPSRWNERAEDRRARPDQGRISVPLMLMCAAGPNCLQTGPPPGTTTGMADPGHLTVAATAARLGAGALFGAVVGLEREVDGHDAGLRTHLLL